MTLRALPAIIWTGLILVFCLVPSSWLGPVGPPGEPSWLDRILGMTPIPADKVVHAGIFGVFGLLWRWAGASWRRTLVGGLVVGVVSELGQSIPGLDRQTDAADLFADLIGLVLALAICWPRRASTPVPEPEPTAAT
jgi:hypothetical protein